MIDQVGIPDFDSPVVDHARADFPLLDADMTVGEALERIRREGVGERVIYFYAVDDQKRLVGVVPTRRLLTAPLERPLREIMVRRVVAVPADCNRPGCLRIFCALQVLRVSNYRRRPARGRRDRCRTFC